jgi:hypothetical protein
MTILDVRFECISDRRVRTLEQVFSGRTVPGALSAMKVLTEELYVYLAKPGGVEEKLKVTFRGAGASRVVYVASDANLAFKLSDIGHYSDDNKVEFEAPVPPCHAAYTHLQIAQKITSSLS